MTGPPLLADRNNSPLITTREQATSEVCSERSRLKLDCKLLNLEGIICNKRYPIEVNKSIRYYELVEQIRNQLIKEDKQVSFSSLELFSHTGYPLANSPSVFVDPISDWFLQQNELIYVSPKNLQHKYEFVSNVDATETVINLQHKNSTLTVPLQFYRDRVFGCDIKTLLSLRLHIPFDCVSIWYFDKSVGREALLMDNASMGMSSVHRQRLCFSISNAYTSDTHFLSSFHTSVYTSCVSHNIPQWCYFNALLLFLVREHTDRERLKQRLGLLRKISCSPPLVYALFLLFSRSAVSLPHRVAINEGLLSTIALLATESGDSPGISHFPQLWMHLEEHASPEHALSEIYETTFISKRTRENPRDEDTRRLLKAFPPNQDSLVTWRDSPSCHEAHCYTAPTRLEEFSPGVDSRFVLLHPMELYKRFLENRVANGLMLPLVDMLSSPCVFMGRTRERYGYFDYFSTENGKCYSFNPHDIEISRRLEIPNRMSYPKIIIILDISCDMNLIFLEYIKARPPDEPNVVLTLVDTALMLIEMIVDRLVAMECRCLLGAVVISNDHEFPNGFKFISDPTLEYAVVFKELRAFVDKQKPKNIYNQRRLPDGIILNALNKCIDLYSSLNTHLRTEIFLFTNCSTQYKYYGAKVNSFENRLHYSGCTVNNVIVSEQYAHQLEKLAKLSKGIHLNRKYIQSQISTAPQISYKTHLFLEYGAVLQDMLFVSANETGTYSSLSRALSGYLITTAELFERSQREKEEYQKALLYQSNMACLHILKKVSAYARSPNPFCKLCPFNNEIIKWLLFIQGPLQSPFEGSVLILEISFPDSFPLFPPKLRFLTTIYHPNVCLSGQVCHPILFEDYSPAVPLRDIIDSVHSMLSVPIVSHAVRYKVLEIATWHANVYGSLVTGILKMKGVKNRSIGNIEHDFKIKTDSHSVSHPPALICPLTNQLFDTPVVTPDGNTYERFAILRYIEDKGTDPLTKTHLSRADLIPNLAISDAVLKHKRKMFATTFWWED